VIAEMDALRQRAQQSMELAREAGENPQFNTGRLIALVTEQDALVRDLLAALEAQQGGWRDISTAPKDGTVIGAWSPSEPGIVRRVKWGRFVNQDGWITATKGCAVSNLPTHWMPLPEHPR
jgi:hypothetical protein